MCMSDGWQRVIVMTARWGYGCEVEQAPAKNWQNRVHALGQADQMSSEQDKMSNSLSLRSVFRSHPLWCQQPPRPGKGSCWREAPLVSAIRWGPPGTTLRCVFPWAAQTCPLGFGLNILIKETVQKQTLWNCLVVCHFCYIEIHEYASLFKLITA